MSRVAIQPLLSSALKLAALVALLLAVAAAQLRPVSQLPRLTFLLDISRSMPLPEVAARWQALRADARRLNGPGSSTIAFAANTSALDPQSTLDAARDRLDVEGTDIAGAIVAGLATLPAHSGELVVLSDGWPNRGDTLAALRLAQKAGVAVHWMPLGLEAAVARITAVDAPATARVGQRLSVAVGIDSLAARRVKLVARFGSAEVGASSAALNPGANTLLLSLQAVSRGAQQISIEMQDEAGALLDSRAPAAVIDVAGPPTVLYVSHGATPLSQSLRSGGWPVSELDPRSLGQMPSLSDYAVIVLDDVGINEAPASFWTELEHAVQVQGTGLLVLGGPRSFGAGSYRGSRLETLLPVTIERAANEQRAAVMFAVDKSGSMDTAMRGVSRLAYAREAVVQTLRALPVTDQAAVLGFDIAAISLVPFGAAPNVADALESLRTLTPSGGTRADVALQEAARQLAAQSNARRLLILVSDGFLPGESLSTAVAALRAASVEFVAIGIGSGAQLGKLRELADLLDGEMLTVGEAAELPTIMRSAADARLSSITHGPLGVRAVSATPFQLKSEPQWPAVQNYGVTRLRQPANAILESALGEPVLAAQQRGNGRVAVMPAGLGGWAPRWSRWAQWPEFAAALATWIGGGSAAGRLDMSFLDEPGQLTVLLDVAVSGDWAQKSVPVITITDPDERSSTPAVKRMGPGRFAATLIGKSAGRYLVNATFEDSVLRRQHLRDASTELSHRGINPQLAAWARLGLIKLWQPAGLAALTAPRQAGPAISFGWLLGAWLAYLAAVAVDCGGVLANIGRQLRSRLRA